MGAGAAAITALVALVTAVIAAFQVRQEGKRIRLELGLNNMWSLIDRWDQPAMRRVRARTAARLLRGVESRRYLSGGAADVLNTFELVAYLVVHSEMLKLEGAWISLHPAALVRPVRTNPVQLRPPLRGCPMLLTRTATTVTRYSWPISASLMASIRPRSVAAVRSPYPTVVRVTKLK